MTVSLAGRPSYLSFLPRFLFSTDQPKPAYIGKAWLLALIPSLILSATIGLLAPLAERPDFAFDGVMLPVVLLLLVVVGPLVETLLMIPPLLLLERVAGPGPAVIGSAILWGVVHSLAAPAWGLVTWWPFLILSIAMLTWRRRRLGTAVLVVTFIHGLQNGVAATAVLLSQLV